MSPLMGSKGNYIYISPNGQTFQSMLVGVGKAITSHLSFDGRYHPFIQWNGASYFFG
jgi:hypothetical protein